MQSLLTTTIVSSNPSHGEMCSIQLYEMFVSNLVMLVVSLDTPESATNKTHRHNLTEIKMTVSCFVPSRYTFFIFFILRVVIKNGGM